MKTKKINKMELEIAEHEARLNSLPSYEGEESLDLIDAEEALNTFHFECPGIVDYKEIYNQDLAGFQGAFVPGTSEDENTHRVKECPGHDHDCSREGCGRSVSEDYDFWGTLVVLAPNGNLVVAAEFNQNVPGGYGF